MSRTWKNKNVLITSGPTREFLDPVRYLSNASSGRMGWALAREARRLGARVTVVSGPVCLPPPPGVRVVPVMTALQMHRAALKLCSRADIVIAAAAVSDWRFSRTLGRKIKRTPRLLRLTLRPNPDIIKAVSRRRLMPGGRRQVVVGFALETSRLAARAREKMARKGLDMIVVNGIEALDDAKSQATILNRFGAARALRRQSKMATARAILKEVGKII